MNARAVGIVLTVGGALQAGCATEPPPPAPASLVIVSGGQSGFVSAPLAVPPTVKVLDQRGKPMVGVAVTFAVTAGGGSVTPAEQLSDSAGVASVGSWTLGPSPGDNTLLVTVSGAGDVRTTISATGVAAVLIVQTAADAMNGDASSPTALVTAPGADGISLREALTAASAATRPFDITFAPAMAGQTIVLASPLPDIRRDSTRLLGLVQNGTPRVTIDAASITACCTLPALGVQASWVTIRSLRLVNVRHRNRGISLLVGHSSGTGRPSGPQHMTNVRITGNVFDNGASLEDADAMTLGADNGTSTGTTIRGVTIDSNTFRHFQGDATNVHLQGGGTAGLIRDVTIFDNAFVDCRLCVELTVYQSDNAIRNTRILRNSFTGSVEFSVNLGISKHEGAGTRNAIDSTLVAFNSFTRGDNREFDASIYGGATNNTISATRIVHNTFTNNLRGISLVSGSASGTTGNRVSDVLIAGNRFTGMNQAIELVGGAHGASANTLGGARIENNIFDDNVGGLSLNAGILGGATGNVVRDVAIVNNTFHQTAPAVAVYTNTQASGNSVTGLSVMNAIFWSTDPTKPSEFQGEVAPGHVTHSIIRDPNFAGGTNISNADPRFVAPASGDFRLGTGSPAIHAGNPNGAPTADFWCITRTGAPDIGAFASGATANQCTVVIPPVVGFMMAPFAPRR